ncbi:MAG: HEAT repeat domain-containing protein [Candidatus Obscuribacterales bacterium]|nr:HEAT repeat domain-containing protein [Candidatus Obscuribacterales bacterium]
MTIEALVEFVDDMIVQNDYPGFEPRSLKIGLPESLLKGSTKLFAQALKHDNVYVKLAALRWFQEKPGFVRPYLHVIGNLLLHEDSFIRQESILCLERFNACDREMLSRVAALLKDDDVDVRKAAAKACGKIASKLKVKEGDVIEALKVAALESSPQVRFKAEKALRKIGLYS